MANDNSISRDDPSGLDEQLHPAIETLDEEEIAVLAAMATGLSDEAAAGLSHLTNREVASALLGLQDAGYIQLGIDQDDNPYITLLTPDEENRPSRRERRQKKRRYKS